MSNATEQNFPEGSSVMVTDEGSKYYKRYGIVEGFSGQFGVKVRLKNGIIPTIDASRIRIVEEEDAEENGQEGAPETPDDPKVADEAKTAPPSKFAVLAKHIAISVWVTFAIIACVAVVSILTKREEPKPAPVAKTEKELAVERINARNVKLIPIEDACRQRELLLKENELDIRIFLPTR